MMILTRKQTADFLSRNDNYVILTHRRPDGDTLGSAALLCRGLRKLGKTAFVAENPEITEKYAFLMDGLTGIYRNSGETVISVDVASRNMLPNIYADCKVTLRLDHHETSDSFTEMEIVEPETAACGEVVYGVLTLMGAVLDEPMADALYTAISTDTGCFRYANTTPDTFLAAAECAKVSKNLPALNRQLFETNSLGRLRVQGYLVENAIFLKDGKIALCPLPKQVEEELGATEDDLDNISSFPRTIEGVKIAATLRQEPGGRVKISVRAVPGYDASAICAKFGGGGHKGAAGCSMTCAMEQAVDALKKAILEM